ncbi:hypothetical protein [Thalassotalea mangrovi]|nr:hypothetical protein [Thalassotalea mangrovi]
MHKSSLREVKLSTVFIAVLVLGVSAMFTTSNASQNTEVNQQIEQQ